MTDPITNQLPGEPNREPRVRDRIKNRIKPATGLAPLLHVGFQLALPVVVFILSSLSIGSWLPLLVLALSKWRVLAVRPRFWAANVRANSVDIMFGISMITFMTQSTSTGIRLLWAGVYAVWLLFIKPMSGTLAASLQSGIAQLAGLSALFIISSKAIDLQLLFLSWTSMPISVLSFLAGLICYLSARHFFESYSEPYTKFLSYLWGYFSAALVWVLGHLLIFYPGSDGPLAQPTLFLSIIGYSLAAVYYLEHYDRLSLTLKRELLYISGGAVIVLVVSLFYEGMHLIV